MLIDFEAKQTFNQTLDVEDPGNCCISCENESFYKWYLVTKSIRGKLYHLEFGPIDPTSEELTEGFYSSYSVITFNEKKVYGIISRFLNDPKKQISNAKADFIENAFEDFPDLITQYKNIN